ncbi:50S ribosomal protein L4 [Caedimonas varicaedens]|uniref:Large ribosomal subunit protein uL4 n=1 Tax=Caedimonas varicaedens TaxID=1629334 RepID=A0A0K8MBT8_9PROT|nr:50S ribosomal protein L4 [Caedimonas varicaedens]
MKCEVKNLEDKKVGDIELSTEVFGLPNRTDILARMVNWQLVKRRAGTHQTRGISMISGTTRKPWKQKGTGRARQGSLRSPQFRGGAVIFGPVVRDHGMGLQKKVRKLALKTALSGKLAEGRLIIVESLTSKELKTKFILTKLEKMGLKNALFIDGTQVDTNFALAVRNLPHIDVLPQQGINVYDILRRDTLVLTKAAIESLEKRLK